MRSTPIFDELRGEMPDAPLCRFCGRVWFNPASEGVCDECFMRRCDTEPERWHCFDCDEFLADQPDQHMTLRHQGVALTLCREHFEWRTGGAA